MNAAVDYDVLIAGAGLSGLAVAAFLLRQQPEMRLLVVEAAGRPGGAIRSYHEQGYLAEWGPHGFLDNCGESRELIALAGLEQEVVKAPLGRFVRYVCLDGRLQCIPQSPGKILVAPLVPALAKFRVLAELWKSPLPGEPTVARWVEHRLGPALLPFADAVFTGTWAGDIERLLMDGVMPGARALEKEHGSLIGGLLARQRQKRREGRGEKKRERQLPSMTSFRQGMEQLPQALADGLDKSGRLIVNAPVTEIAREAGGWSVRIPDRIVLCRHLVLAGQINAGLRLVRQSAALPRPPLDELPEARLCSVLFGFAPGAEIPMGFGYLAPRLEKRFALGALFSSHMFSGRAPQGHVLLEVLVGGRLHPDRLKLSDGELQDLVLEDLRGLLYLPHAPVFQRVLRPEGCIPQAEEGYPALLAWREKLLADLTDFHLCGFGWGGIGINDMCKEAKKMARRVLAGGTAREEAAVKPVYF